MTNDDLGLQTLLAVRGEVAPAVDSTLLQQCYEIQKRHQFTEDRAASYSAMERLIDAYLANHNSSAKVDR